MAKAKTAAMDALSPEDQTMLRSALRGGATGVRGTLLSGGNAVGEPAEVKQSAGVYIVTAAVDQTVETVDGVRLEAWGPDADRASDKPAVAVDLPSKPRAPVGTIAWATFGDDLSPYAVAAAESTGEVVAVPEPPPEFEMQQQPETSAS